LRSQLAYPALCTEILWWLPIANRTDRECGQASAVEGLMFRSGPQTPFLETLGHMHRVLDQVTGFIMISQEGLDLFAR
jgi:hypothetical protein